jgi:hypothetical protein
METRHRQCPDLFNIYLLTGSTSDLQDAFDLVERRRTGEDGLACYEFTDDAAHRPHIDSLRILS